MTKDKASSGVEMDGVARSQPKSTLHGAHTEGEWVLVPREPTEEMRQAGGNAVHEAGKVMYVDQHGPAFAYRAYRAMLSAAPPPSPPAAWRPIETAPRDGTELLLFYKGRRCVAAHWNGRGMWISETVGFGDPQNFTHWQPLPEAPR